ncbi:MAG: hypothetical protein R3B96_22410 [Pirellulaceae bacterium]
MLASRLLVTALFVFGMSGATGALAAPPSNPFAIAPFSLDVTIPLDHRCMGVLPTKSQRIVDPLQLHGLVVWGAEQPIVFCAVDWCEIRNGAYDQMRATVATAAGTVPEAVLLSALHQHDAPVVDTTAGELLAAQGLADELYQAEFFADVLTASIKRCVTPVSRLKRSRTLVSDKPKSWTSRPTAASSSRTGASAFAAKSQRERSPIGRGRSRLDRSVLRTLSFWDGDRPLAAIHSYATHPMSYYGRGRGFVRLSSGSLANDVATMISRCNRFT